MSELVSGMYGRSMTDRRHTMLAQRANSDPALALQKKKHQLKKQESSKLHITQKFAIKQYALYISAGEPLTSFHGFLACMCPLPIRDIVRICFKPSRNLTQRRKREGRKEGEREGGGRGTKEDCVVPQKFFPPSHGKDRYLLT